MAVENTELVEKVKTIYMVIMDHKCWRDQGITVMLRLWKTQRWWGRRGALCSIYIPYLWHIVSHSTTYPVKSSGFPPCTVIPKHASYKYCCAEYNCAVSVSVNYFCPFLMIYFCFKYFFISHCMSLSFCKCNLILPLSSYHCNVLT